MSSYGQQLKKESGLLVPPPRFLKRSCHASPASKKRKRKSNGLIKFEGALPSDLGSRPALKKILPRVRQKKMISEEIYTLCKVLNLRNTNHRHAL